MGLKVGELYTTLQLRDDQFQSGMANAESRSTRLTGMLKKGVAGAAVAAGTALVGMARTGAQNMRDVEDATQRFRSETGAAEYEAETFSETIQALHKTNTESYEELGDAVTTLRQRHGELGDDAEEITQKFLDFAKVTEQDSAQAIDEVTDLMNAWNIEVDDAGELMDTLLAVSQETGADIGRLQGTLAETAPVMDALNMEIEEGAALLGHFEQQGVGADKASRGLRNALSRMEDPTDSQREALERLGVEFDETGEVMGGTEEGLQRVIERLSEGEVSSSEMDAALEILGRRAGQDMVRALEDGEAGIEELMGTIADSEDAVEEASEQYDKQLGERWTLIRRQYLEPFMEVLGDRLLSVLEKVLGFLEEWGPKVKEGFATVTAFVTGLFENLETDTDSTFGSILNTVTEILSAIMEIVQEFIDAVGAWWEEHGEYIMTITRTVWDMISGIIDGALTMIHGVLEMFLGLIQGDWGRFLDGLKMNWQGAWTVIESVLEGAWDILRTMFDRIREELSEIWDDLWNYLSDAVRDPINTIIGFINGLMDALERMTNAIARSINNIPRFEVPDWVPGIGGGSFGLPNISTIDLPRIPTLHQGGEFRAPTPGGEGLALLRDREIVKTPEQAGQTIIIELDGREIGRAVGEPLTEEIRVKTGLKV